MQSLEQSKTTEAELEVIKKMREKQRNIIRL